MVQNKTIKLAVPFDALQPQLAAACQSLKLTLSDHQQQQLLYYLQQLLVWNKAFNLTAIKDPHEALVKHIFDSLAIVPHVNAVYQNTVGNNSAQTLLDVGTGAGLPAAVIAIALPDLAITALDSNAKKVRFIKQMVGELGLTNLYPIAERIEAHTGQYAMITSRAFASLPDFVSQTVHCLAADGTLLAMKGVLPVDEIAQFSDTWQVQTCVLTVPQLYEARHLVQMTR